VILIDLWWNNTTEQQAFGRVYRMGQKKNTHFVRILSSSQVDKYLSRLQTKKAKEIDLVLQDREFIPKEIDEDKIDSFLKDALL
jgi:SNF2 family DNA or RNA helicase